MSSTFFSRRSRRSFVLHSEPSLPVETCTYPAMKFGFFGTSGAPSIRRSLQYEGLVCCLGCSGPHENTCEPRFLLKRFASGSSSSSYEFNPCKKIPLLFSLPTPLWKGQRWRSGTHTLESFRCSFSDYWPGAPFIVYQPAALDRDAHLTPLSPKRNLRNHFLWEGEKWTSSIFWRSL